MMLCIFPSSLISQTHVLHDVSFSGAPAYSQAELKTFVGLKAGSSVTQQQLEDATQKLTDTGLFEEVTFAGNDKGVVFALKPAAAETARPAAYANFVWWSDDELNRALKASVPLFRPEAVPISGSIQSSACAALTTMLEGKGVTAATVHSRLISPGPGRPVDHLGFAIDSPQVLVRSLILTDASPSMRLKLDPIIHDMTGQSWGEVNTYADVAGRVNSLYRNNGYVDIAVMKQEHSAPVVTPRGIELDVTSAIGEGVQYRVAQVYWPGSNLISSADFGKRAKLKAGDVDSPLALQESLQVIRDAYGTQGYIAADVAASQTVDRGAHQVAYAVSVAPGSQYHFHSVRWPSLNAEQAKGFDASWEMKPGDVFDASYPMKFLAQKGMLNKQNTEVSIGVTSDSAALTVDLVISTKLSQAGH